MPLDPKKLRKDARRLQGARPDTTVGRETTGTTRAIRTALPDIYDLRNDGVSWPAIADALAIQGVVQGKDRIPLTTNRLTAIVSQIEEQERKKASKAGGASRPKYRKPPQNMVPITNFLQILKMCSDR